MYKYLCLKLVNEYYKFISIWPRHRFPRILWVIFHWPVFKFLCPIVVRFSIVLNILYHRASRTTHFHEACCLWIYPRKMIRSERCAYRIPSSFTWRILWRFNRFCIWLALLHRTSPLWITPSKWTINLQLCLCPHIYHWQKIPCISFSCFWTLTTQFHSLDLFSSLQSRFSSSLRSFPFHGRTHPLYLLHSMSWAWWVSRSPTCCHFTSCPSNMNHHRRRILPCQNGHRVNSCPNMSLSDI